MKLNKILIDKLILLVCSLIYVIYTLFPFRNWLRWNNFHSEPFPDVSMYQDSIYYLGQIREVLNGNYRIGNPLIFENSQDGFSYGNSSLFYIWGSIGRILDLNLIQTYLLMIIVNSATLFFITYVLNNFFIDSKINIYITIFVCVFLIGPLGRPSPTQQLLPVFLITVLIALKQYKLPKKSTQAFSNISKITFTLAALVLAFGNQYYSLNLVILLVTLSVLLKRVLFFHITVVLFLNASYFFYTRLKFDSLDEDIAARLGLHYTRLPGAIAITLPLIIVILCILVFNLLYCNPKLSLNIKLILALNLSLLFALNSQIFTGIAVEMESHYRLIWYLYLGLILNFICNYFLAQICKINLTQKFSITSLFLFFMIIIFSLNQFKSVKYFQTERSEIIQSIYKEQKIKSVLIKTDSKYFNLSDEIILLTNSYLYWEPSGAFSRMSKQNIISRFACTRSKGLTYGEFISAGVAGPTRQEINSQMKAKQYKQFLDFFGIKKEKKYFDNTLNEEYKFYIKSQQDCIQKEFQFRVDKIIE